MAYTGAGAFRSEEIATLTWSTPFSIADDAVIATRVAAKKEGVSDPDMSIGFLCLDDALNAVNGTQSDNFAQATAAVISVTSTDFVDHEHTFEFGDGIDNIRTGTTHLVPVIIHETSGTNLEVDEFTWVNVTESTHAEAAATAAATSAATATTQATAAGVSATAAQTSETNAATSASSASVSESNAATSASNAGTSETNASNSAAAASSSAVAANSSAASAGTSAANAATSETNAGNSATSASNSASAASTSATNANSSAAAAGVSETNAATSATNAGNSETAAGNSATAASASQVAAASSASSAGVSETNAATSASSASGSATSAAASATTAAEARLGAVIEANRGHDMSHPEAWHTGSPTNNYGLGLYTSGTDPTTLASSDALAGGNLAVLTGAFAYATGRKALAVNTSRKYRLKARYKAHANSGSGTHTMYMGYVCLDENYAQIEFSPAGATWQYTVAAEAYQVSDGWITQDTLITTEGANLSSHSANIFRAGTKYIVPFILANYSGDASSVTHVDYLEWIDVTEEEELTAIATVNQTAIADIETGLAASVTLQAVAGSSGALLELVAADGVGGTASSARIDADNIILDGTVTADHISVTNLEAISGTIGTFQTSASGARTVINDDGVYVYHANGNIAVELGLLL